MMEAFERIFHKELAEKEAKAREKGLAKGREEGREETLAAAASFMEENGMPMELIARFRASFLAAARP